LPRKERRHFCAEGVCVQSPLVSIMQRLLDHRCEARCKKKNNGGDTPCLLTTYFFARASCFPRHR